MDITTIVFVFFDGRLSNRAMLLIIPDLGSTLVIDFLFYVETGALFAE